MNVNVYANLREIVGAKTVDCAWTVGTTVAQLLEQVIEKYPGLRPILLDENGRLYGHVHLFVNGRDVPYLEHALATALAPDDTIDIFPAVAGGWGYGAV